MVGGILVEISLEIDNLEEKLLNEEDYNKIEEIKNENKK